MGQEMHACPDAIGPNPTIAFAQIDVVRIGQQQFETAASQGRFQIGTTL